MTKFIKWPIAKNSEFSEAYFALTGEMIAQDQPSDGVSIETGSSRLTAVQIAILGTEWPEIKISDSPTLQPSNT